MKREWIIAVLLVCIGLALVWRAFAQDPNTPPPVFHVGVFPDSSPEALACLASCPCIGTIESSYALATVCLRRHQLEADTTGCPSEAP